jgi:16S rRNA (cytosine967-C5)-methyltransferase
VKYFSHVNTATKILSLYKGQQPFAIFLKDFFSKNKKYGSKDRKQIASLCYCYFRLGKAGMDLPLEDRLLQAYSLCIGKPDELLQNVKPDIQSSVKVTDIFPWEDELSAGIDHTQFCNSFLIQPDLYIRVRPGFRNTVVKKLKDAGIRFDQIEPDCISLPNATKIENIIELNKEAVVQDYSSQQIKRYVHVSAPISVWDCCAASGGKSILIYDMFNGIELTVSDIRESILVNLKKRFAEAGIKKYTSFVADLTKEIPVPGNKYDLIIADVPCTGSGTWSRTPEQLFYFDEKQIDEYANKQKKIVSSVIPFLKPNGILLYVTCSVFKKENEEQVKSIPMNVLAMDVFKGYDKKADTMFAALLQLQ